jgi:glycosyltransferase involved in cell wall biosynthesis
VDRSEQYRVIPALLALIRRLALHNDVHVFALNQEDRAAHWEFAGARVHNVGVGLTRLRAVRAIISLHRQGPFDVVHSIWSGSSGQVAVAAARLLGIPSVVHVAGGELVAMREIRYGGRLNWRGRVGEACVLRAASVITSASAPITRMLANLGLSGRVVPLGVDLNVWPPREPVRREPGRSARLLHVATLNRVKDQTTLLRALASLHAADVKFEMHIVGEDLLQGVIQRLAAQLGLADQVHFRGFMTQSQLRPLFENADLLMMSSRHETGPLAMLEAAVAGLPTVGTAVGQMAEWAPEASVAVPVGDFLALANAARQLLENEDLRLRIAQAAHRRALAEDADFTAETFQALYRGLTAADRRPG